MIPKRGQNGSWKRVEMKVYEKIFDAMNDLAEARHIYVRDAPKFDLTPEQKKKMQKHLKNAKKSIAEIEKLVAKKAKAKK